MRPAPLAVLCLALAGCANTVSTTDAGDVGSAVIARRLSTHLEHTCVVRRDASLWCWGNNRDGQLGKGDTTNAPRPVRVAADRRWTSVAAGFAHTCAIDDTASLSCWGRNLFGQLGDGTHTRHTRPAPVGGGMRWRAVGAGGGHTCAIRDDGTLWCWGGRDYGQNDQGFVPAVARAVPVQVSDDTTWVEVDANWYAVCA